MKQLILIKFLIIFTFTNSSAQDFWKNLNVPTEGGLITVTTSIDGLIYYSVEGGIYYSSNNNINWKFISFDDKYFFYLKIDSIGNIFAADYLGYYKYDVLDEIWYLLNDIPHSAIYFFMNSTQAEFVSIWGGIYKKAYNDTNWVYVLETSNTEVFYKIVENSAGVLYAGSTDFIGDGGGVYQSIDGGNTWQHIGLENHYVSSIALNSKDDLYAATYNSGTGVFVLHNGDSIWEHLYNDWLLMTAIVIDKNDNIYIGSSNHDGHTGGVIISSDFGLNWEQKNSGLTNSDITKLHLGVDNHLYAIANSAYGQPLFRSVNPVSNSYEANSRLSKMNVSCFPNPVKSELNVQIEKTGYGINNVELCIYSLDENLLEYKVLINNKLKSIIKCNFSKLPAGIYFLEVKIGNEKSVKKIIHIT